MHRELSHADAVFGRPRTLGLYVLTATLGLLLVLDLLPVAAQWLGGWSFTPRWGRELLGVRFAMIAAVLGGARALFGALERLIEGRLGADLALAIACIAAILIREYLVAAEVVFIGLVGECLEAFTFERTQNAVRKLVEVFPRRCWLLRDGQEVRVFTHELQVGDRVVVKPGGKVPVDGILREGRSAVDTSALTGESVPRDVGPGDAVLAGSVNQTGAMVVEANRVGEQTVAGRVIELTARALKDKAPSERIADRLAGYFLPVVLGLALLTFLVALAAYAGPFRADGARLDFLAAARRALYPALSVLVVSCPCALILATPAAVIAALGRLAGTGVLVKGGSALERLAAVKMFAFDKTGTLTEGRLEVGDILPLEGVRPDDLLSTAATAEQSSEHPLARAILQRAAARKTGLEPVAQFVALPGAGVRTIAGEQSILVGSRRLFEENGLVVTEELLALLNRLDSSGQTPLLVARDGRILGAIGARDRVRPEAARVLAELRTSGIERIALLTGDREAVARSVANSLGIDDVHSELLPEDKANIVAGGLDGGGFAYEGDGINDALALARATVGLAVGSGTDVAAEAGDIVLMGNPLQPLPLLLRLSRETVKIIWQNILYFAIGVNLVGVAITAWLWPIFATSPAWFESGPIVGAIYHQFGSLAVLLNSMRLLTFERRGRYAAGSSAGDRLKRIDLWLEHAFNIDEWFHTLSHHWRWIAAVSAMFIVVIYIGSGLTAIGPEEIGIVHRFGQMNDEAMSPGLHWHWPWPVETVTRIAPGRLRELSIGFRSTVPLGGAGDSGFTWSSVHGPDLQRMPSEGTMMTGDGNLVELLASVRYRIAEPRRYLTLARDPEVLLRAATESVFREEIAGRPFRELLTTERGRFQIHAQERLKTQASKLGIALDGLTLHDLHPPAEVVEAYHNVARAQEERDRQINDARAAATKTLRQAEAKALQTVRIAEGRAAEFVALALATHSSFVDWHRERTRLDPADEARWIAESIGNSLAGSNGGLIFDANTRNRNELLARRRSLTDFRLAWEAISSALSSRSKVIVDVDKVPGRRQLMLFDPEQFVPGLQPRGGKPPSSEVPGGK